MPSKYWSLAMLLLIASIATAGNFVMPHNCIKPIKALKYDTSEEIDKYYKSVENYKNCMTDFVEKNNEAADKHQNAANEAAAEWNEYIETE